MLQPEPAVWRRPIVGVMGSGDATADGTVAEALGALIARHGWHLLTGGGRGAMTAAARGFCAVEARAGLSIGIIPIATSGGHAPKDGYPNPWIELPVLTHLTAGVDPTGPTTRNHINVLSAGALVFCAGNDGTAGELVLAERYGTPRIACLAAGETIGGQGPTDLTDRLEVTDDVGRVEAYLTTVLPTGRSD